jgi:UDP-N-acetyl-D-glucosamine dehydrogenase
MNALLDRIQSRHARVGVIGLGYVGLPLAVEFARAGFSVVGFDVDTSKIDQINNGVSYIPDVRQDDLAAEVKAGRLKATTNMAGLADVDVIDICRRRCGRRRIPICRTSSAPWKRRPRRCARDS